MSNAFMIWLVLAGTLGFLWFIRLVAIGFTLRARQILSSRDYASGPTVHSAQDSAKDCGTDPAADPAPRVSVVVAAKDEEGDIETCVTTLLDQDYSNFEVIAVDDRSSDRTPAILSRLAEQNPDRLRVITISELRTGWFGKNNAMRAGVEASTGEWLLFTDADCRQTSRRTFSVALSEARHHECDFLCITPVLDAHSAWERILQPVCALVLIIWFLPQRVNNPKKKTAYANGAFMLMRRSCYDVIGGHERVRTEVNEDIHLARHTKEAGLKLRVVENADLYRTRMYATPKEAWRGWSRILYGSLGSWRRLTIAVCGLLFFSLQPWISLAVALVNVGLSDVGLSDVGLSTGTNPWTWAAVAWGGVVFLEQLVMWRFYAVLKVRRVWSFTYPLGCVVTFGILINAILKAFGAATTTWRGTTYHGDRVAHAGAIPPATET